MTAGYEFVVELARDPDLVARLLAAHVPDADGRCKGCALNPATVHVPHPCGPQGLAQKAQERIRAQRQQRWITP